jgi:aminoglycoside phosphotransferase family enzyme/predicted kinase
VNVIAESQAEVVHFLSSPSTFGGSSVERIDTHTALVFLAGSRAYKLKRAVRYDYVDFSTLDRRRAFCEEEVRLNRRTAPGLYRGVVPVCRASRTLTLGGSGTAVEWLVEMNRFDQSLLFDRLAGAGTLELALMGPLASAIAGFHALAAARTDHGGSGGMAWVIDGNAEGFDEFGGAALDPALRGRVTSEARAVLQVHAALLDERRTAGRVRQCHGDIHLRNIVLLDGRPTIFDGVEFNDKISCIDVLYDLAFLLMDLWRRRLPRHANVVLNRYLSETADLDALPLLPLFLSCRAAVRAKTSATAASMESDLKRRDELQLLAADYLEMADRFLHPPPPCLVAIGGLSGSGKSTVAAALAADVGAAPGAMVFRSDETRKRLCGVPLSEPLGPEGYTPEVSQRVYDALFHRARSAIRSGQAAIVDGVFAQPAYRLAVERLATETSVPFVGCWLDAPDATLIDRVERRSDDPSDADGDVVRSQLAAVTGPVAWNRVNASPPPDIVVDAVRQILRRQLPAIPAMPAVS